MKLIFCPKCQDVLKLQHISRTCMCGRSYGCYVDDLNAEIGGDSIPLGFDNISFAYALKDRPKCGRGFPFDAFVIPVHCVTIKTVVNMEDM